MRWRYLPLDELKMLSSTVPLILVIITCVSCFTHTVLVISLLQIKWLRQRQFHFLLWGTWLEWRLMMTVWRLSHMQRFGTYRDIILWGPVSDQMNKMNSIQYYWTARSMSLSIAVFAWVWQDFTCQTLKLTTLDCCHLTHSQAKLVGALLAVLMTYCDFGICVK